MIRTVEHRGHVWQLVDENPHTEWVMDVLETWEPDTFDAIDRYVNGGVFVDVGAWIGMFTLYAAPKASHVYAFEPDPVAYDMLVRNLALNDVENVTVYDKALWEWNGSTTFYTHEMLGDSMTGPTRTGEPFTVRTSSVADLRREVPAPDLVKIDTEGSEQVLLPLVLDWDVPIHLSVHEPQLRVPLDYQSRRHERHGAGRYHTVVLL